uniref:Retrovirus-related Pol polyprotein from transposon 297 family n=1 Tax=Cajanus cajan TaxID=3821 RepID=A0A151S662_CAJCA|nr:Retrovirus-related Pol polyprotein from transposon 297 family [Cajanus cajan]
MRHFDSRPAPAEDVKEVSLAEGKTVKIGVSLAKEDEEGLLTVLKSNVSAFAWGVGDMPGIDPDFLCHRLMVDPKAKPVIQKRRKFGEDKKRAIAEETKKLLTAGHIREIQYPTWLANVVMVRKSNGNWRMCTDFTDLNKACPKDSYPLPNIDCLRLMDKVLADQLGRNVEAYVDDMVVKSPSVCRHFSDLQESFDTLARYQLKLNPAKCSFGVQAGKFLGFLLTHRGIEANPDKCSAIISMRSPAMVKEVQQLTGRMASLSRVLQGAEVRYQKIEKLALAILVTARKLRHYFQSYEVVVRTDHPIRQVLQKPDLAGKMMKWSVELSEYSIKYEPRGAIKAQTLADFVMELTSLAEEGNIEETQWILSVDGASNLGGSGAGIVLEGLGGILLEQSLRFEFRASNNQVEYEALLAGMKLAKEMGATSLSARSDSQLITGQVAGTFQAKDPQLAKYLEKVKLLSENFREFTLNHVPREQNSRADLLSKLASTKKPGATRSVIQETLAQPSINEAQGNVLFIQEELNSWMGPYIAYITRGELPEDKREASLVQKESARFVVINERLYQRGFSSPLLRCLIMSQAQRVMDEIHSGMCGSHIGGRALVYKVARAGYFWPSLRNDCVNWVQKCDGCQRHATLVRDFCKEVGIRMAFTSVEHPQSNGQAESANKVILSGLKKRVQDSGTSWVEELPRVLWSYHTIVHSSTQDTPFNLVYGTDAMIPIEIVELSVRTTTFSEEESDQGRRVDLDLITETRERAKINQVAAQRRAAFKYNTKVVPRDFVVGDLVLKRAQLTQMRNKLSPKWVGPYKIDDVVGK